ncbi:putative fimB [Escherichia coli 180050]|nr:fimB [Escherichia coli DEC6C]EMW90820.1 putative fimB [Escherichia coli 180050]
MYIYPSIKKRLFNNAPAIEQRSSGFKKLVEYPYFVPAC